MKKLKMVLVAGVLAAVSVLSVSGLVFADDTQAAPATAPAMTNTSSVTLPPATTPDATPSPADTTPAPAPAPAE
ncbi:MAG: hypothetical protein WA666_10050 [Nitrospirota bacterium]